MLDFGFSEILLTSAIALVVLGPERLPKVARQVGNWMGRARAMARQLSEQLEREVNAEDLLKQELKFRPARSAVAQDPVSVQTPRAALISAPDTSVAPAAATTPHTLPDLHALEPGASPAAISDARDPPHE